MNNQDFEKRVSMTVLAIWILCKEHKLTLDTARAEFLQLLQRTEIHNFGNYTELTLAIRNLVLNKYLP
jgi:hypothetical protein